MQDLARNCATHVMSALEKVGAASLSQLQPFWHMACRYKRGINILKKCCAPTGSPPAAGERDAPAKAEQAAGQPWLEAFKQIACSLCAVMSFARLMFCCSAAGQVSSHSSPWENSWRARGGLFLSLFA